MTQRYRKIVTAGRVLVAETDDSFGKRITIVDRGGNVDSPQVVVATSRGDLEAVIEALQDARWMFE